MGPNKNFRRRCLAHPRRSDRPACRSRSQPPPDEDDRPSPLCEYFTDRRLGGYRASWKRDTRLLTRLPPIRSRNARGTELSDIHLVGSIQSSSTQRCEADPESQKTKEFFLKSWGVHLLGLVDCFPRADVPNLQKNRND